MADSVALVTGGGRGIGRAICRRFARSGAHVVCVSRSADELAETRRLIEKAGGACTVQEVDLRIGEDVDALVHTTAERLGRIDALVNCAGAAWLGKVDELDPRTFATLVSVNIEAVYRATRAVWPVMRTQGGGVIVNISSMASLDPFPGFAAYGASKAWVNTWTKALADEGREVGIRLFAVAPGAVETQMLRSAFPDFPKEQTLDPGAVADMVFALTQPECGCASGQTIFVKK